LRSQIATSSDKFLRSQSVTLKDDIKKDNRGKHRKYLPYAFTEQGVAMLSAVLKSETAVKVSIRIMEAFVAMRRFLINNAQIFQRIDTIEKRQLKHEIETNEKFEKVFNALQSKEIEPRQGIFLTGRFLTLTNLFPDWCAKRTYPFC